MPIRILRGDQMNQQEAIQKAVKLLRLAKSDNPHEAAQATARAQEIIDRYKLGQLSLDDSNAAEPEEPIKNFEDSPLDENGSATWKGRLAMALATSNQCKIYLNTGTLKIIGCPSDAETLRYMYAWLAKEVDRLTDRDGAGNGKSWRNNFRLGVVDTIARRLREQHKETAEAFRADAFAQKGESSIVLVNQTLAKFEARAQAVEDWQKANFKLYKQKGTRSNYNGHAREAGRQAGESITLNNARGGLGAGRKALP